MDKPREFTVLIAPDGTPSTPQVYFGDPEKDGYEVIAVQEIGMSEEKQGFVLVGQATFQAYNIENAILKVANHFLTLANEMGDPDVGMAPHDFMGSLEVRPEDDSEWFGAVNQEAAKDEMHWAFDALENMGQNRDDYPFLNAVYERLFARRK